MRYEEQNCNTLIATRPLTGERSIMLTVRVCLCVCVLAGISPLTRPVKTGPPENCVFSLKHCIFLYQHRRKHVEIFVTCMLQLNLPITTTCSITKFFCMLHAQKFGWGGVTINVILGVFFIPKSRDYEKVNLAISGLKTQPGIPGCSPSDGGRKRSVISADSW